MIGNFFKGNVSAVELSGIATKARALSFTTDDVKSLFRCRTRGIVRFSDKQHIVLGVIHLLQLIGTEMGNMDPLFKCVPELKGSVQEYSKCGELDELDTSMKLVNFRDYFATDISVDGIKIYATIAQTCNRY